MINPQIDIASFTMRFIQQRWKDQEGDPQLHWKGYIRHVQSDDSITFTDFSNALNFIQQHLMELTANATSDASEADQNVYIQESFKLWESFLSNYSSMVFSTMDNAIKQSEAIQAQIEKAARTTMGSISSSQGDSQEEILVQIRKLGLEISSLQSEMESIQKRLDELSD